MLFGKNFFMLAALAAACMVQSKAAQCNVQEMELVQQCLIDNGMTRILEVLGPRGQSCNVSRVDDELCTLANNIIACVNNLGLEPPCRDPGFAT